MEGWGAGDPRPDLLVHGREPSRSDRFRSLLLGTLAVALVAAGGWTVLSGRPAAAPRSGAPVRPDGTFERTAREPARAPLQVTVHNDSARPVTVLNLGPRAWAASSPRTTVRPGHRAVVPLNAVVNCAGAPPITGSVTVAATAGGRHSSRLLPLPRTPTVLTGTESRLCLLDVGPAPRRREVLGIWLAERGRDLSVRMLVRLDGERRVPGPHGHVWITQHLGERTALDR